MTNESTWPRPCPYCRGYSLERRCCSHCDTTGLDPEDVKRCLRGGEIHRRIERSRTAIAPCPDWLKTSMVFQGGRNERREEK